jgi:hypothetical protein
MSLSLKEMEHFLRDLAEHLEDKEALIEIADFIKEVAKLTP